MSPAWMESASCAQTDPELFFAESSVSAMHAKRICRACPVIADCRAYAIENDERYGIWAGVRHTRPDRMEAA